MPTRCLGALVLLGLVFSVSGERFPTLTMAHKTVSAWVARVQIDLVDSVSLQFSPDLVFESRRHQGAATQQVYTPVP